PDEYSQIRETTIRLVEQERKRVHDEDILVLSRTNHLLERIDERFKQNQIPVAKPDWNIPGVRVLSAHKAKGLEAKTVIIVNASAHPFGFPSKVENPDVLGPVRMSFGNDEAEERRLFYVAITRSMNRLHLVARQGHLSPYIAEIEGVGSTNQVQQRPSSYAKGVRFN